jgi:hypothetical protein
MVEWRSDPINTGLEPKEQRETVALFPLIVEKKNSFS